MRCAFVAGARADAGARQAGHKLRQHRLVLAGFTQNCWM
jgi:hypothetical protein